LNVRILHSILTSSFYGSERYCAGLAAAQAREGHVVSVLVQAGKDSAYAHALRRILEFQPAETRQGSPTLLLMPPSLPPLLQRPYAWHVLRQLRPEIVHTHLNPDARRVGKVAQRLGIPHVATLHLRYEPREHGNCDGLIALAKWQQAQIATDFAGEVAVVGNWLPIEVGQDLARVSAAEIAAQRRAWSANESTFVFGSIGRLMPEKGMDWLIRSFLAAFPRGDEAVRLVLYGDGPLEGKLKTLAGADRRIAFAGTTDEIARCYLAFDAFVSAARFEPFGLAIIEAMGAGCPLVASSIEGTRSFVTDSRVLWAEPDDVPTLTGCLNAMAARGRHRVAYDMTAFAPAVAVRAIEALYRNVIARRHTAIRTPPADR